MTDDDCRVGLTSCFETSEGFELVMSACRHSRKPAFLHRAIACRSVSPRAALLAAGIALGLSACSGCLSAGDAQSSSSRLNHPSKGLFESDITEDKEWQRRVREDKFAAAGS